MLRRPVRNSAGRIGILCGLFSLLSLPSAHAQVEGVYLRARFQFWLSSPRVGGRTFQYGRDAGVGFTAVLPKRTTITFSYALYDFPRGGPMTDEFHADWNHKATSLSLGRSYAPFGSPLMSRYDRLVEPSDAGLSKNAFLAVFGDGGLVRGNTRSGDWALAILQDARVNRDQTAMVARFGKTTGPLAWGLSHFQEFGGTGAHRMASAIHLGTTRPLGWQANGEYLWGKPSGTDATCLFAATEYRKEKYRLFARYGEYRPEVGALQSTTKIGGTLRLNLTTSLGSWFEGNRVAGDRSIVQVEVSL